MKLSEFNFDLPEELIASYPVEHRDESRLMVLHKKDGSIEHRQFKDLIEYVEKGDAMVFNNTKVIPARLYGKKEKTNAQIEVFLLRELNPDIKLWDVLVDPARKIRIGNKLFFGSDDILMAEVIDNTINGGRTLRFLYDENHEEFKKTLYAFGKAPLPTYMNREATEEDLVRFQTIYAEEEGAVVAPAAGLHFSRELMKRLEIADCKLAFLTLHNGLGNFENQDIEDLSKHKKNNERMIIGAECCLATQKAHDNGKKIFAVGTSVLRALETAVSTDGYVKEFDGWTNKYIYPPCPIEVVDALITNFHLPQSLLLMNAAAVAGYENIMEAYKVAIKEKYRFGAYGDAMLII